MIIMYVLLTISVEGGDYMLLENGKFTREHIAFWIIRAQNRVRQAVNSNVHPVQSDTNELNEASDGVGDIDFDHGLPQ